MKCLPIPDLSYGRFSKFVHEDAARKRIPISGGLELTFRCNLKCKHCYVASGIKANSEEHSFREVCKILDAIADEGCLWLLITGGEPLARKDFLDIYVL